MGTLNANWYNLQCSRKYPVDDVATGVDDAGLYLPDDILVDCHLRFPNTLGTRIFIGGVTVTRRLVSVVLLAESDGAFVPVGSVNVPQPVTEYRHYNVVPMADGVGGFLVFGGGVREDYNGRFSTADQSFLMARCCRAYSPLPITSLGKVGRATSLQGLVYLLGTGDIEAVADDIEIDGRMQRALILRLAASTTERNVLAEYTGPCATRPESRTCNKEGVETINGVEPDCDGNIDILFVGVTAVPYSPCGSIGAGTMLEHSIGITEVCLERAPDHFDGVDYCLPSESSSSIATPDESSLVSSISVSSSEGVPEQDVEYAYCADFAEDTAYFVVVHGTWGLSESPGAEPCPGTIVDDSSASAALEGCYAATSGSVKNTTLFTPPNVPDDMLLADCRTVVQLLSSHTARNGGLILNYHLVTPLSNPHYEYFWATLDQTTNRVKLYRYNGAALIEEHSVRPASPLVLNHWYRLLAVVTQTSETQALIEVTVEGITNPAWTTVNFSVATSRLLPMDGRYGLGTDRASTNFGYFYLDYDNG